MLIIFGGTNDSWSGAPVGSIQWENWTDEDLKKVLPAFCYLLCRVKKVLPKTQTAVIINTELNPEIESRTDSRPAKSRERNILSLKI